MAGASRARSTNQSYNVSKAPGDLAYVTEGALMLTPGDNLMEWTTSIRQVIVIAVDIEPFVTEQVDSIDGLALVLDDSSSLWYVEKSRLMSPDQLSDPSRFFRPMLRRDR